MGKLLCANFSRLGKAKIFYLTLAAVFFVFLFGGLSEVQTFRDNVKSGFVRSPDQYFFNFCPYLGAFQAVFISFFLGTEYSDGTIRNKLVAGHLRTHVYLASFLTCFAVSSLFLVVSWIAWIPFLLMVGPLEMGVNGFLLYALVALGYTTVYAALYTMIASLSSNKAATAVGTIILWFALIFVGSALYNRLEEPEIYSEMMTFINGEFVKVPPAPNPLYLAGTLRTVCEFFRDLLPSSQAILMYNAEITGPGRLFFLSTVFTAVLTVLGITAFRRKDIK